MIASASSCRICGNVFQAPIYRSTGTWALSSLSERLPVCCQVWYCDRCGHLQSAELPDLAQYYAEHYRILDASEEDDQLYAVEAGGAIFRAEHQARTFLRHAESVSNQVATDCLPHGARVLDFGCAKGATSRQLSRLRPDLSTYLFDVSERYTTFWSRFSTPENWATLLVPDTWFGTFDAVMSYFVLEHVSDLLGTLNTMRRLLKPGGMLYAVVPNVFSNPADLIVADHLHHFSGCSIVALLNRSGFRLCKLDDHSHESAWVVTAQRADGTREVDAPAQELADVEQAALEMAAYWAGMEDRIRSFESEHAAPRAAIYGAGFYGTLIAANLALPEQVACFMDRNPHLQGRQLCTVPVVAPQALPTDIRHVYVGLNPRLARESIAQIAAFADRNLEYFYL